MIDPSKSAEAIPANGRGATTASPDKLPSQGWWPDVLAVTLCVAVGLLMATLPYLLWSWSLGEFVYIADGDDMTLYMPIGSQAYFDHPTSLADPARPTGGLAIYPWLQMVPGVMFAKALGWGPMGVNLAWRLFAGVTVPLGWYFVLRQYVKRPSVAAALAVVLMCDIGLVFGTPLLRQSKVMVQLLTGHGAGLFNSFPRIHTEWRIATPGLSLIYLLLYLGFLGRALARPTWPRILAASAGLGLLIHAYFYFWTAAGLGLALAILLDARNRKTYLSVGILGSLIGLPAVLGGMRLKAASVPDYGPRLDTFLPIKRLSEIVFPSTSILLLTFSLAWVWFRRKDLLYIWCLATSGTLLLNQQVVSGMQIQNFHWQYAAGPALFLLLLLLIQGELSRVRNWPRQAFWAVLGATAVYLALGLWLRAEEAMRTSQTRQYLGDYDRYRTQRRAAGAVTLAPHSVIAGQPAFVNMALVLERQFPLSHNVINHSSLTSNDEWDARIALDACLNGIPRSTFASKHDEEMKRDWGPWLRDPSERARRLANLLSEYDAARVNPQAALDRFRVRYFAGSASQVPPGGGWTLLERGRYWDLWERAGVTVAPGHESKSNHE
ncbi:MAG: hypothetical protein JWN86_1943 [Planctomycetota bacterium]|nr:hypothetical protein [Planctomycetota bacterium]